MSKRSTPNGFAPILIVILIALAVGGYFIYKNQQKPALEPQATNVSKQTSSPESTNSSETVNWKTYQSNPRNGFFSLKYPSDWEYYQVAGGSAELIFTSKDKKKFMSISLPYGGTPADLARGQLEPGTLISKSTTKVRQHYAIRQEYLRGGYYVTQSLIDKVPYTLLHDINGPEELGEGIVIISLRVDEKDKELFESANKTLDQILSTFKFIN